MAKKKIEIAEAKGKLGVILVGLGAVATTFVAGVELAKLGHGKPFGSITQYRDIRFGKRDQMQEPWIKDFVPLDTLDNIVFGAWDIRSDDAYKVAVCSNVLPLSKLQLVQEELASIKPMQAVFEQNFVKMLTDGDNIFQGKTKMDSAEKLKADIRNFKIENDCERVIILCVSSTEMLIEELSDVHLTIQGFEQGLYDNSPEISPSMIYAYAAAGEGVSFINGTPNQTDIPALIQLAKHKSIAICGKDFKTGQTLLKTVLASMFKSRALGINGHFSTNILGNRDGLALNDPGSFKSKEKTKGDVLKAILNPERHHDLYGNIIKPHHNIVDIRYYPPQGDNKVGIDFVNFFGWMGEEMILTYTIYCKDSILAAGLCLDLILFMDLAVRAGYSGVQEWLSFYFKAPMTINDLPAIHALFEQELKLMNWLRHLMGKDVLNHLGLDYEE